MLKTALSSPSSAPKTIGAHKTQCSQGFTIRVQLGASRAGSSLDGGGGGGWRTEWGWRGPPKAAAAAVEVVKRMRSSSLSALPTPWEHRGYPCQRMTDDEPASASCSPRGPTCARVRRRRTSRSVCGACGARRRRRRRRRRPQSAGAFRHRHPHGWWGA
jgi:hypothetical protein